YLGADRIIPAKRGKPTWHLQGIRAQMRANFPVARYRQRSLVEIVCTQMTKSHLFAGRRRRDDVADLDVAVGDHHAVNEQLNELAPLVEGGVGEPDLYPVAEVLH